MKMGKRHIGWLALAVFLTWATPARAQYGIILSGGSGPIQRSMGGTGTATTLDSLGGLFWNPATLSGLPKNEMTFGAEFLLPHATVSSSVAANTFRQAFFPDGCQDPPPRRQRRDGVAELRLVPSYRRHRSHGGFGLALGRVVGGELSGQSHESRADSRAARRAWAWAMPSPDTAEFSRLCRPSRYQLTDRLSVGRQSDHQHGELASYSALPGGPQ